PRGDHYDVVSISEVFRQQLTHQSITGQFIRVKLKKTIPGDWTWISRKQMAGLAFPKFINQYLQSEK
ncbi:MAG TPA: A/G-specific adenine glycosylase, partial [Chitinophagaceae bacterium]|nr:A/G-specific adenine glycosylase [Chitinophagaceae bacterium]